MMQKDEDELLQRWIVYHAHLFGIENLFIFDNDSHSQKAKSTLLKYQELGLNVSYEFTTKECFERKGKIFGAKINELELSSQYDCFIPLDCDEFIAVQNDNGAVSCDKQAITYELEQYRNHQEVLMIDSQYYNSVISPLWFNKQPYRKCFFMAGQFLSMDVGFHWAKNKFSNKEIRTKIVHFHFHNKPFHIAKAHAKEKLMNRVPNFDSQTLRDFKGAGIHLIKFFLQNEEDSIQQHLKLSHMKILALKNKFSELSICWPYIKNTNDIQSRLLLDKALSVDDLFESKVLPIRGSIDCIEDTGDHYIFVGWAVSMLSAPLKIVFLKSSEQEYYGLEISRVFERKDVNEMLNVQGYSLGFELKIDKSVIQDNLPAFAIFQVLGMSSEDLSLQSLVVNRKFHGFFI